MASVGGPFQSVNGQTEPAGVMNFAGASGRIWPAETLVRAAVVPLAPIRSGDENHLTPALSPSGEGVAEAQVRSGGFVQSNGNAQAQRFQNLL